MSSGGAGSDAAAAEGNERSDKEAGEDSLVIDEAESNDADSDEKVFEPTIDMMMNDFDDERTLEEEEAMEGGGGTDDEVNALEQESELPLEELLKLYNYDGRGNRSKEKSGRENYYQQVPDASEKDPSHRASRPKTDLPPQELSQEAVEKRLRNSSDDDEVDGEETPERTKTGLLSPPTKKSRSELVKFYEGSVEGRSLRSSVAGGQGGDEVEEEESDSEGEDSEGDADGRDYSWKKTIMIGPAFQASVPVGLSSYEKDALPYENEDKLLWDPRYVSEREAEVFLGHSQESVQANGVGSLPLGAHIRDDEQALYLLLQCGYNCEEALRRRRMNSVPPADTMSLWSEEECRAFELGLRLYGKDFHMIQQQKVRTRSVGELVQFYYLWKKTERHDVFATATRLEKKKYTLHPGTTDYMDRFIDEQDRDRSSSPTFPSVLFKKQLSENGDNCSPDTSPSSILASGSGSSVQPVPPLHLEEANFQ